MDKGLTFERVRDAVAASLGLDPSEIMPESRFVDLGATSLDRVQLLLDLEDDLGVEIPNDDGDKFNTPADVLRYFA